jgi:hypothetical protein
MRRAGISGRLHSDHALFGLDPLELDRQLKSLVVSFIWISAGFLQILFDFLKGKSCKFLSDVGCRRLSFPFYADPAGQIISSLNFLFISLTNSSRDSIDLCAFSNSSQNFRNIFSNRGLPQSN